MEEQSLASQPRDRDGRLLEIRRHQQRVVGTLLEMHPDGAFVDFDRRAGVDEISEQVASPDDA